MKLEAPNDTIVDVGKLQHLSYGEGVTAKVVSVTPASGRYVVMLNGEKGAVLAAHRHLGAVEFYILKGQVTFRGGTVTKGMYGYEPNSAIHSQTTFDEGTERLFFGHGPIEFLPEKEGGQSQIFDWEAAYQLGAQPPVLSRQ